MRQQVLIRENSESSMKRSIRFFQPMNQKSSSQEPLHHKFDQNHCLRATTTPRLRGVAIESRAGMDGGTTIEMRFSSFRFGSTTSIKEEDIVAAHRADFGE